MLELFLLESLKEVDILLTFSLSSLLLLLKGRFVSLDPKLKHMDRFCPEIYVHFVSTQSLELIFSLVEIFELLLQRLPEPDANLRGQVIVLEVLRYLYEVYNLVFK
jgi:hypothetical protein